MLPVNHWRHLATILPASPKHATLILQRPCPHPPPEFSDYLQLREKAAAVGLLQLLQRHLLSCIAYSHSMDEEQLLLFSRLLHESVGVSSLPAIGRAQWIVFPIPVTQGRQGRIVHILMGHCGDSLSRIVARQMAPDSIAAVAAARDAFNLLDGSVNGTLILLPMLPDDSSQVTGRSLGLPCAIALYHLTRNRQWPKGLLATGNLTADCRVHSVSGLQEKQDAMQDIRCCIVPENEAVADSRKEVGCCTLNHAIDAVELFSLATDPELINRYRHPLADPKHFLDHFHDLPPAFLAIEKCQKHLRQIGAEPHQYLEVAAKKLQSCTNDPARVHMLANIYKPEQLAEAVATEPKLFRHLISWCVGRLAHANHSGETAGADPWLQLHDRLQAEMPDNELLESLNHRFITTRLNRYFFSPEIPSPIAAYLEGEAQTKAGCRANRYLGAMYGTLAQNCGFCGPACFDQLNRYCDLAEQAFSHVYTDECRRLQAYRLYGLLDREDRGKVADLLNPYLDLPPTAGPLQWLAEAVKRTASKSYEDLYTALLTLRTVADLIEQEAAFPAIFRDEAIKTLQRIGSMPAHHPWQLIAFNVGRLFLSQNVREKAVSFFEQSIAVCRRNCETMQAMALLGYAELHKHALATSIHYQEAGQVLKNIDASGYLNRNHFVPLLGKQAADALEKVAIDKRSFFPFSYR